MKNTKTVTQVTVSLLCAVLILSGLPLNAAGPAGSNEALRHAAFLRGGNAISVAIAHETAPAVSKAFDTPGPAAGPAPVPAPPKAPAAKAGGLSKPMWGVLVGGFVASAFVIRWAATGPGASIRNCSTCSK